MTLKFVGVVRSFAVRSGFVALTVDLDQKNAERAQPLLSVRGAFSVRLIRNDRGGLKWDSFLESTSVIGTQGRRLVLALPRPVPLEALDTMVERQIVVEIKKF